MFGVTAIPVQFHFGRLLQIEHSFHLRLHLCIHLDERRPGASKAFTKEFLRRVDPEFGADGHFAGGVVEHVGRALVKMLS